MILESGKYNPWKLPDMSWIIVISKGIVLYKLHPHCLFVNSNNYNINKAIMYPNVISTAVQYVHMSTV